MRRSQARPDHAYPCHGPNRRNAKHRQQWRNRFTPCGADLGAIHGTAGSGRDALTQVVVPGRKADGSLSKMELLMLIAAQAERISLHGFRSAFRDLVRRGDQLSEAALAHTFRYKTEAAYQRRRSVRVLLLPEWSRCGRVCEAERTRSESSVNRTVERGGARLAPESPSLRAGLPRLPWRSVSGDMSESESRSQDRAAPH
jgi:hypothetical protein